MFIRFDPRLPQLGVDLTTLGIEIGDTITVDVVGDFRPSNNPFDTAFYQDTFQAVRVVNSNSEFISSGPFQVIPLQVQQEDLFMTIINDDTPLHDNSDPDGDYGLVITKVAGRDSSQDVNTEIERLTLEALQNIQLGQDGFSSNISINPELQNLYYDPNSLNGLNAAFARQLASEGQPIDSQTAIVAGTTGMLAAISLVVLGGVVGGTLGTALAIGGAIVAADELIFEENSPRINQIRDMIQNFKFREIDTAENSEYSGFDEQWYLANYSDAEIAINQGTYLNALHHYLSAGFELGYSVNELGQSFTVGTEFRNLTVSDFLSPLGVSSQFRGTSEADIMSAGNDQLVAALDGDDTIFSSTGNLIFAGAGNDAVHFSVILSNQENSSTDGGTGIDTAFYETLSSAVEVYLNSEFARSSGNQHTLTSIENVSGTAFGDILVGDDKDNILFGNGGNDSIFGNDGSDTIGGGSDNDIVRGGNDDDWLYGNDGIDTINGDAGVDRIWGGEDGDLIGGDTGDDILNGEAGNDWMWGGGDNDTLGGGEGSDRLWGDDGNDWLYGNSGSDTLNGGSGNDRLFAGDTNHSNSLGGDGGTDLLYSGFGSDWMWGGSEGDAFIMDTWWEWHDHIMDFQDGADWIDVSAWGFTSTTGTGATGFGGAQLTIVDDASGNAFISLGYNSWITVYGVSAAQLSDADFWFG